MPVVQSKTQFHFLPKLNRKTLARKNGHLSKLQLSSYNCKREKKLIRSNNDLESPCFNTNLTKKKTKVDHSRYNKYAL